MTRIAYFTDVEGQWSKLGDFLADNPWVRLGPGDRLEVAAGVRFVFGGDAIDRGPAGRRIIAALLEAKERQPDQVVLLAGNRDINKMRLVTELAGQPPAHAPLGLGRGPRAGLLRWIFEKTMGARDAFRFRQEELAATGEPSDDDAVVESFLGDLRPRGPLARYLASCQLAHREGDTLFVHGGVTNASLGYVPEASRTFEDVNSWCAALNEFYAAQCQAFLAGEPAGYAALVAYQAPSPGTRENRASVVYGRSTDLNGAPTLPEPETIARLRRQGIDRLVVGHTPVGDCPALLRDGAGFSLLAADNSYGRIEPGSQVFLGERSHFRGETVLEGGTRVPVMTDLGEEPTSPLGLRDAAGRLVKARLIEGDYLLYRALPGHEVEQLAGSAETIGRPWRAPF